MSPVLTNINPADKRCENSCTTVPGKNNKDNRIIVVFLLFVIFQSKIDKDFVKVFDNKNSAKNSAANNKIYMLLF
jgi:hypothetical protein